MVVVLTMLVLKAHFKIELRNVVFKPMFSCGYMYLDILSVSPKCIDARYIHCIHGVVASVIM